MQIKSTYVSNDAQDFTFDIISQPKKCHYFLQYKRNTARINKQTPEYNYICKTLLYRMEICFCNLKST